MLIPFDVCVLPYKDNSPTMKSFIHHHQIVRVEQHIDLREIFTDKTNIFFIRPFIDNECSILVNESVDSVAKKINDMEMLMKKYEMDEK